MNNSKGSLILKGLSPGADEEQLVAYLGKRAKSISPEKIPELLRNLPVVLSRNVAAATGTQVVEKLRELGAEALFLPQNIDDAFAVPVPHRAETDAHPAVELPVQQPSPWIRILSPINQELWIILAMLAIALLLNFTIASQYLLLGLYTLPAVLSAYLFGRRQAVLTAGASILLVGLISHFNPGGFESSNLVGLGGDNRWDHIVVSWGCVLLVTAHTMGTLHERNKKTMRELRRTYQGLLLILRRFIAQDEDRENHCYRVAIYATRIATHMGLDKDEIEDIRSAALLHDLASLRISRSTLYRAACFSQEESSGQGSDAPGKDNPLCGSMGRILPMVLGQQVAAGSPVVNGGTIPLGTRILVVADAFDTLTTSNPDRVPLSPDAARQVIVDHGGTVYDPEVVKAFTIAFDRLEMELPAVML